MPSSAEILEGLSRAAAASIPLALLWHAAVGVAGAGLALGWRPSRRSAGLLLVAPLLSVSAVAWVHGNPFNGAVFLAAAVALAAMALGLPRDPVPPAPAWTRIAGPILIAVGWIYPHFLETRPAWLYLFAAPLGVVPCPTLSAIEGFSLLAGALGSRAWAITVAALGLFYGVFGAFRLGVHLDLILIAGALALVGSWPGVRIPARPAP